MPQEVPKTILTQLSIIGARTKHRQGFSRSLILPDQVQQGTKRLSTVAVRPSGLVVNLRHRALQARKIKERIVSETTAAPWSGEDLAFDRAFRGQNAGSILGEGQRAAVAGAAFGARCCGELL